MVHERQTSLQPMKTMKGKTKLKKNVARFGRIKLANKATGSVDDPPDFSQLRKPIDINVSSLKQVAQLLEKGSDEVRMILTYECDVVYECRICRSLFRSLANFISHKRVYCPEKYNVTIDTRFVDRNDRIYNKNVCINSEEPRDYEFKENCTNDRILRSQATRQETRKDLTSVVEMLQKQQNNISQNEHNQTKRSNDPICIRSENEQVLLEIMESNQAAYQTVVEPENSTISGTDLMKSQTLELKSILSRNTAVLGPDGQLLDVNNIERVDSQCANNEDIGTNLYAATDNDLTCSKCNARFATKKTLTFHVKSKHTPHRIGYSCPCCLSSFTNTWSVYRHLFKVHRKTNEQVRKLRSQIQARAFRRDLTRFENNEKETTTRKKSNENSDENLSIAQEWLEHLELDTELQRCGACGKRFDRKAALVAHLQICQKRNGNTRDSTGRHKRASKIPPQRITEVVPEPLVVESVEKSTHNPINAKSDEKSTNNATPEKLELPKFGIKHIEPPKEPSSVSVPLASEEPMEISIRVEGVSSLSKDVWDLIGTDQFSSNSASLSDNSNPSETTQTSQTSQTTMPLSTASDITSNKKENHVLLTNDVVDVPEVIYTSIDNSRPITLSGLSTEKKLGIQYRGIRLPTVTLEKINFPRGRGNSTLLEAKSSTNESADQTLQLEKKIASMANMRNLKCLPCDRTFSSLLNLRRHLAIHLKWYRYRCKLCEYKSFMKCDCIAHCNMKHNTKNNRTILANLVIEIPPNIDLQQKEKSFRNVDTVTTDELEVIDVTEPSISLQKVAKPPVEMKSSEERVANLSSIDETVEMVSRVPPTISKPKPKVGRPVGRGRKRKRRAVWFKRKPQQLKTVSPPSLADVVSDCDEVSNITSSRIPFKVQPPKKSSEFKRKRAPSRMDCDPELRRMVMEVIFGSTDGSSFEGTEESLFATIAGEASQDFTDFEYLENQPIQERLERLRLCRKIGRKKRRKNVSLKKEAENDKEPEKVVNDNPEKQTNTDSENLKEIESLDIPINKTNTQHSSNVPISNETVKVLNIRESESCEILSPKISETGLSKINVSDENSEKTIIQPDLKAVALRENVVFFGSPAIIASQALTNTPVIKMESKNSECEIKFPESGQHKSSASSPTESRLVTFEEDNVSEKLTQIEETELTTAVEN